MDRAFGDGLKDPLLWAIRPTVPTGPAGEPSPDASLPKYRVPSRSRRLLRRVRNEGLPRSPVDARNLLARRSGSVTHYSIVNGALRLWSTENQQVALGARRTAALFVDADHRSMSPGEGTRSAAREVEAALRSHPGSIVRAVESAAALRGALRGLLSAHDIRVVAVADTERPVSRLAALVARDLGVPSVYIPHAPTSLARSYADIPTDLALVHGEGDLDYYSRLGANASRLHVVGNPMIPDRSSASRAPAAEVLLATSADRPAESLAAVIERLVPWVRGEGLELVLAPHPRDRGLSLHVARQHGLRVLRTRTSARLATAPPRLLLAERASGILIEALRLGIPSARLDPADNYAFEADLGLQWIASQDDLRRVLRAAPERDGTGAGPAQRWASDIGSSAGRNITHLLHEVTAQDARGPVLDSWGLLR